jgi:hypothetical protein
VPAAGVPLAVYTLSDTVVVGIWADATPAYPSIIAANNTSNINTRFVPLITPPPLLLSSLLLHSSLQIAFVS